MLLNPDHKSGIGYNPIEFARTYEQSIPIISEAESSEGFEFLRSILWLRSPDPKKASIIHIERAGRELGVFMAGSEYQLNPMRMSHTGPGNVFLPEAYCKQLPDVSKLFNPDGTTRDVFLVDLIVETQSTLVKAREAIDREFVRLNKQRGSRYAMPNYHPLAFASKIGENEPQVPGLVTAFKAHPKIWYSGLGCDDEQRGRESKLLKGRLPPKTLVTPQMPYYTRLF